MIDNKECCGTCRYHVPDGKFPDDWMCANEKSEHVADWTEYDETCDFWEERPKRRRAQKEGMRHES